MDVLPLGLDRLGLKLAMTPATAMTQGLIILVPLLGFAAVAPFARLFRRYWLAGADAVTAGVLAAVVIMSSFLGSVHLVAFGRMFGFLPGLSAPGIALCFAALLAIWAFALVRLSAPDVVSPPSAHHWRGRRKADWLCLAPIVVAHLFLVGEALSRTPKGWDGLKYHLPVAVSWLRADALVMRPEHWEFSLPCNGELLAWWVLKGGAEHIASAVHFPAGVLLAGAVWAIVRSQRGSRFAGVVAVATVLSTHMVVSQMYSSYIDLFGTAFLAAGMAALLLAIRRDQTRSARRLLVVIGGVALGIAIGTKPVNWGYALAVAVVFIAVHLYRNGRKLDLSFVAPAFVLACLGCSAFWFVRAALHTGNPLYPIQIAIGGRVVLAGVDTGWTGTVPVTVMLSTFGSAVELLGRLPGYAATLNADTGGVGPLYSTFVPAGIMMAVLGIAVRGRRALRHDRLVVVLLTLVLFAVWVFAIRRFARLGMIYLVAATCLAAPTVGWVARFWPRSMHAAAVAATCLACATVTIKPWGSLHHRLAAGDLSRAGYYRIPRIIDDFPPETRIINLTRRGGRALTYPLYGKGLKNEVLDSMTTEALFPDLKPTVKDLHDLGIEYVFIREPFYDDWPEQNRLELIHDDEHDPNRPPTTPASRIYRVPAPALRAQVSAAY